jgi:hypothetical protein
MQMRPSRTAATVAFDGLNCTGTDRYSAIVPAKFFNFPHLMSHAVATPVNSQLENYPPAFPHLSVLLQPSISTAGDLLQ